MTAYHSPDDVTKSLRVSDSTLRKYALLLEKAGYSIEKNNQGQRWYSDADVMALRKFMTFSKSGGMNLEEAADAVYWWSKGGDVARPATIDNAPPPAISEMADKVFNLFSSMTATIEQQEQERRQDMDRLTAVIERQAEEMGAMRAILERLETEKEAAAALPEPEPIKKGFLSRLFN